MLGLLWRVGGVGRGGCVSPPGVPPSPDGGCVGLGVPDLLSGVIPGSLFVGELSGVSVEQGVSRWVFEI